MASQDASPGQLVTVVNILQSVLMAAAIALESRYAGFLGLKEVGIGT
jgi:hypothetical protein